jgi:PAS domain S-box-containing protein
MTSISNFGYNINDILTRYIEDPIFILNEKYEFEYSTENFHLKNLGLISLENKITEIFHPNDFQRGVDFLQKMAKFDQAVENLRVSYGDNYRFYEFKGRSFKNEAQETKYLITTQKITQLKKKEEDWNIKVKNLRNLAETMPEIRFWKLLQTKDEKSSFQKSREMLDLVIDNIPQFIYWKNKEMVYIGCNQKYALINNLDNPNFIIGKKDIDLPWSRANFNRIHERERILMQNNQSESIIESWILPDGCEAWFEINRIPLHNINNNIVGILSTYNDITNRVKAERKSITLEKNYKEIIKNVKEAYFEVDLKGNFTFANPSFLEIIRYSYDELIGRNYGFLVDKENKEIIFKVFNSVYSTERPKEFSRFSFIKKNKIEGIVETSVYLNQDVFGSKKGFYGIGREITEKDALELKLKQSEEKYRHLFENSPYAIWIFDLNGIVLDCNSSTGIIFPKHERKDLIGKNFVEIIGLFARPEYYVPFFKSKFESFIRDEPMKRLEFKMTSVEGIDTWMNLRSSKITLGDETLIQVLVQDITEKKKSDLKLQRSEEELKILNKELEKNVKERTKELRESEEKFRTIAEHSTIGITILQDEKIKYANEAMKRINGFTIKEMLDWTSTELVEQVYLEDREKAIHRFSERLAGAPDIPSTDSYRITTKNGEIKWIESYSKTITYQGKNADLALIMDVTEQKRAQEKLKESEEKFRTIAENSLMGIAIIQDNKIKYVNQLSTNLTGYTVDETKDLSPMKIFEFIHPKDRIWVLEQLKKKQSGSTDYLTQYQYRIINKAGEVRWLDNYSKSIEYLGKPADLISVIDITDRMKAEQELKESEEKYRHLYENSPFSIVLLNNEGKIIDMNQKTTDLFGYKKEDLIDKNYLTLMDVFPKETIPELRLVEDLMSKGEPSDSIMIPQITKIYNREKKLMWVESELSAVRIGGELIILAIIQDVTEKKLAEEKLKESERLFRQQNIELKELDRLKTDFISIAAHDLKTPLISVGGYVDLILLREKDLNEEVKEDLKRVLNNVRRLEDYINRLLDVMKIDAKKVELVKKEEKVDDIIESCLFNLEFQINQKDLTVNVDFSENLKLRIDHFKISQVFLNLLSNAVKFTPKKGNIKITVVEEEDFFLFKIKDNGRGLTSEEIRKIFGKFVSIEQGVDGLSTLDKGTGLGLYIARGFIEAHGGKIWVESEGRNLGSEFSFTLPKQ